jgi:hypothetical protein
MREDDGGSPSMRPSQDSTCQWPPEVKSQEPQHQLSMVTFWLTYSMILAQGNKINGTLVLRTEWKSNRQDTTRIKAKMREGNKGGE